MHKFYSEFMEQLEAENREGSLNIEAFEDIIKLAQEDKV